MVVVLAGFVITIASLRFFPAPFIWIFFSWFIAFLFLSKSGSKSSTKIILFYISFIPFTLGVYEMYLWMIKKPEVRHRYPKGMINMRHDILGYAPYQNTRASHARYYKDQVIFDVVYTIDANGLRRSPPHHPGENQNPRSILFFGGSFTFGTGVNDEETTPYLTGIKTQGKYCIYNFGFRGYGPHQMLAAIEHGIVERIVKFKPKYVIYIALIGHISRAAGLMPEWDKHGPRYILKEDGNITYNGHFNKETILINVVLALKKSLIFKKILTRKDFDEHHINLFIQVVNTSKQMMETRYPGCEFHVLLWGNKHTRHFTEVLEKLKQKGIRIHLIDNIFKRIGSKDRSRLIIKNDGHPTPFGHGLIAEYVAGKIIKD